MTGPPLLAGPHAPATSTPPRAPGSVRRTTSIDTVRPDGPQGPLVVDARGRDLRSGRDDADRSVLAHVALRLALDASHTLADIEVDGRAGDVPDLRPLLGAPVGPGFRRLVDRTLPVEQDRTSIAISGSVDARRRRIVDLRAEALVLPWVECPAAVAGAGSLRGTTFDDLRLRVRHELVGTASCTHLNDMLRSLADLGALLPRREGA